MELKQLVFQPKLRSSWQVYDLAQLMLRQFGWRVFLIWAILVFPLAAVLALIFNPVIAWYLIWWLKPVFERPLLYYYSRAVFAQSVTVRQALISLRLLRWRDWLRILTWHRLRWRRAYLAPVEQLEQLSGVQRQRREQVLLRLTQDHQAFWLMFCLHLESLIVLVAGVVLWSMLPQGWSPEWTILFDELPVWLSGFLLILYLISMCLIAPLFTLGGFLMYLNRRIELEAWDLELAFKVLLNRLRPALTSILLVSIFLVNINSPVYATELSQETTFEVSTQAVAEQDVIASQVAKIYQSNQLIESTSRWQIKQQKDNDTELSEFWVTILAWLGKSIGYLAWGTMVVLVMLLLFWLYRNSSRLKLQRREVTTALSKPIPLFFADLPKHASPAQLLQLAAEYLDAGQYRRMLACMLRAAIELVQFRYNVKLSANMTEQECLVALQRQLPAQYGDIFQQLFHNWIASAWAHQTVSNTDLNNILTQLRQWLPASEPVQ